MTRISDFVLCNTHCRIILKQMPFCSVYCFDSPPTVCSVWCLQFMQSLGMGVNVIVDQHPIATCKLQSSAKFCHGNDNMLLIFAKE